MKWLVQSPQWQKFSLSDVEMSILVRNKSYPHNCVVDIKLFVNNWDKPSLSQVNILFNFSLKLTRKLNITLQPFNRARDCRTLGPVMSNESWL